MKSPKQSGFSIIEALIAIAIVIGGFLVVFSVIAASLRLSVMDRNRETANMIAQSTLEQIRANAYGVSILPSEFSPVITTANVEKSNVTQTTTFKRTINYQNGSFAGNGSQANYDVVSITISWDEGTGKGGAMKTKTVTVTAPVRKEGADE
jgi:type II secretory pathway pseudopilin PulG